MEPLDADLALASAEQALDAILVVVVSLGGAVVAEPPGDALDVALRGHEPHLDARRAFAEALGRLRAAMSPTQLGLVLEVEEAANQVTATATDVGFALGAAIRTGRPRR